MALRADTSLHLKRDGWREPSSSLEDKHKIFRRSCCECVLLSLYVGAFIYLMILHTSLRHVSMMERTMKVQLLERPLGEHSYTVSSINDRGLFWQWLEEAALPVVAVQEDEFGKTLSREDWGYIAAYNKVVGGIRLSQERDRAHMCTSAHVGNCSFGEVESTLPFGSPACNGTTDNCYTISKYKDVVDIVQDEGFSYDTFVGKFEFWLVPLEPLTNLRRRLDYLKDRRWIDFRTRRIIVEILSTNQQYEPLICIAKLEFSFDRTGYITKDLKVDTIPGRPYHSNAAAKIVFEIIFTLITLVLLVRVSKALFDACRQTRSACNAMSLTLRRYWHEILNILTSIALIYLWIIYVPLVRQCSQQIDQLHMPTTISHTGSVAKAWLDYHHGLSLVEESVEHAMREIKFMHRVAVLALFVLLLRFLRVWEGIPAVSTVVVAIRVALPQLMALAAASVCLLLLYAGMGVITFGAHLEEFSSILTAFPTTAVIVVSAESEVYQKQKDVDRTMAILWFWTLIALLFVVVLNLILAALVNAFSSINEDVQSITLLEQAHLTFSHYSCAMTECFKHNSTKAYNSNAALEDLDIENAQLKDTLGFMSSLDTAPASDQPEPTEHEYLPSSASPVSAATNAMPC